MFHKLLLPNGLWLFSVLTAIPQPRILVLLVKAKEQRLFQYFIKLGFNKIVPIHKPSISIHKYLLALELLAFVNEMKG